MIKTTRTLLFLLTLGINTTYSQAIDTLVQVGSHRLHFTIYPGNGTPLLFESGNGEGANAWQSILPAIHDQTGAPLISYDRAGLGRSEIDTASISFQKELKDLKKALTQLGFGNQYFLVAHSFGGMYASEFSNQNNITGAVFIDVSTPCNLDNEYANRVKNSISDENWRMLKQYRAGLYYVLKNFPEIADYMSERYLSNEIPLTLIVASNYTANPQIGESENDMQEWKTCLKEFGRLPKHSYVSTENTDHKVWLKDPDTVIKEITQLYLKVSEE